MSIYVRNNTAATIARGQAVYSDGVAGGLPRVALAKANAVATMPCIGIALEPIDPNQDGRVGTNETVTAMDTSAFTLGDLVYVSAATAGALTATVPASPNIVQRVGRVTFVSARDGRLSLNLEAALFSADGVYEISGPTPELRFKESDQVAPAGEWRWKLSGDVVTLERALTANYATVLTILSISGASSPRIISSDLALRLHWNNAATEIWHNDGVVYTTDANSSGASYYFGARNSASTHTSLAQVANGADPLGANAPAWLFINRPVHFYVDVYGPPSADWNLIGRATRSIMFKLHNDAASPVDVLYLRTNDTTPMVGLRAPNITPTTTLLPATFLGFVVDGTDQLTAYWNDAGTIRSLVIGTLV